MVCSVSRRSDGWPGDNTAKYPGLTLQLFPGTDRTSYARTRVEVQERLDGRLLVSCRGKILTPEEAPPLAAELRASVDAYHANGGWAKLAEEELYDPFAEKRAQASQKRIGLGWEGSWYENEDRKCAHRDLVLAGMERARLQGKRIGRPKVIEQEGVPATLPGGGESYWRRWYIPEPSCQRTEHWLCHP